MKILLYTLSVASFLMLVPLHADNQTELEKLIGMESYQQLSETISTQRLRKYERDIIRKIKETLDLNDMIKRLAISENTEQVLAIQNELKAKQAVLKDSLRKIIPFDEEREKAVEIIASQKRVREGAQMIRGKKKTEGALSQAEEKKRQIISEMEEQIKKMEKDGTEQANKMLEEAKARLEALKKPAEKALDEASLKEQEQSEQQAKQSSRDKEHTRRGESFGEVTKKQEEKFIDSVAAINRGSYAQIEAERKGLSDPMPKSKAEIHWETFLELYAPFPEQKMMGHRREAVSVAFGWLGLETLNHLYIKNGNKALQSKAAKVGKGVGRFLGAALIARNIITEFKVNDRTKRLMRFREDGGFKSKIDAFMATGMTEEEATRETLHMVNGLITAKGYYNNELSVRYNLNLGDGATISQFVNEEKEKLESILPADFFGDSEGGKAERERRIAYHAAQRGYLRYQASRQSHEDKLYLLRELDDMLEEIKTQVKNQVENWDDKNAKHIKELPKPPTLPTHGVQAPGRKEFNFDFGPPY